MNFFDERHILSREEVFSHSAKKPEFGKMNCLRFSLFGFLHGERANLRCQRVTLVFLCVLI